MRLGRPALATALRGDGASGMMVTARPSTVSPPPRTLAMSLTAFVIGTGFAGQGHTAALRHAGVEVVGMAGRTWPTPGRTSSRWPRRVGRTWNR